MSAALDDAGRGPLTRQLAAAGALTLPKYRADIDGLRAIAVLSVIGFHTSCSGEIPTRRTSTPA